MGSGLSQGWFRASRLNARGSTACQSEWRVCLKSLGRETESKPKSQTWGQWHAANLWGDWIRGWVESNDRAKLWSRGHDSLRMRRALPPTPLSTGHSHGSPPRATHPTCHTVALAQGVGKSGTFESNASHTAVSVLCAWGLVSAFMILCFHFGG